MTGRAWAAAIAAARQRSGGLASVAALALAATALELLQPWPLKLIVDEVLPGRAGAGVAWLAAWPGGASRGGQLAWLAVASVLVFVAAQAVHVFSMHVQAGLGARLTQDAGAALFDAVLRTPLGSLGRRPSGDLVRRIVTDSGFAREAVLWVGLTAFTSTVTLASMFVVLWTLDPLLSIAALAAGPPLLVLTHRLAGPLADTSYEQEAREGALMAYTEQTLSSLQVVQAFVREPHGDRHYRRLSIGSVQAYLRATDAQLLYKVGTTSTTALATAGILVLGGWRVLDGHLTTGSLLVFLSYLAALYSPIEGLAYLGQGYASASAHARRVSEVLDPLDSVSPAGEQPTVEREPATAAPALVAERVSFSYEPGRAALDDASLEARAGEMVALVGESGSGKSTMLLVLAGLLEPAAGCVDLDGRRLSTFPERVLRKRVAIVFQEPFLFSGSVAENIAAERPELTRDDVVRAARAAHAHEFIVRLPRGYDTPAGERGDALSGGERQRLAIARALCGNPGVLLMDEPTSAVDAETERALVETVLTPQPARATVVIAHRLSTVRRASRVYVFSAGRVVEAGRPDELIRSGGAFAALAGSLAGGGEAGTARGSV